MHCRCRFLKDISFLLIGQMHDFMFYFLLKLHFCSHHLAESRSCLIWYSLKNLLSLCWGLLENNLIRRMWQIRQLIENMLPILCAAKFAILKKSNTVTLSFSSEHKFATCLPRMNFGMPCPCGMARLIALDTLARQLDEVVRHAGQGENPDQ